MTAAKGHLGQEDKRDTPPLGGVPICPLSLVPNVPYLSPSLSLKCPLSVPKLKTHKGRLFRAIGLIETETGRYIDWLGECRICGAPFTVRTRLLRNGRISSKAFRRVHCDQHKQGAACPTT